MTDKIRQNGYVLTLYEPIPGSGQARVIDPLNVAEILSAGRELGIKGPLPMERVRAVYIEDINVLRIIDIDLLLFGAIHTPGSKGVWPLKDNSVQSWGLRPLHRVTVERLDGSLSVTSVDGLKNPEDVKAIPYYGDFRLRKEFAAERIPIERIAELADAPPPTMNEGQLYEVTHGGIVTMRMLSYYAPVFKGVFLFDAGAPKTGKTFAMRMFGFVVYWLILQENPGARAIYIGVGERGDELGEQQGLAEDAPDTMEFFITGMDDLPTSKWVVVAYCGLHRGRRLLEYGHELYVSLDSLARLAGGITLAGTGGRGRGAVPGGHAPEALVEPRAWLGLAGNYVIHPQKPTCTVIATGLLETSAWDVVPSEQMGGTSQVDWKHTTKAHIKPQVDLSGEATSARNLGRTNLTPLELWFIDEQQRRMARAAMSFGRYNAGEALLWLKRLYTPKDADPQVVMRRWWRMEQRLKLCRKFDLTYQEARVCVDDWGLTFEQVQTLAEMGLLEELEALVCAGVDVPSFLAGQVDKEQVFAQLADWQTEWGISGYTAVAGEEEPLPKIVCKRLREAGISASRVRELLAEGQEFSQICEAVRKGENFAQEELEDETEETGESP